VRIGSGGGLILGVLYSPVKLNFPRKETIDALNLGSCTLRTDENGVARATDLKT
jgi:hypothetical protein